MKSQTNASSSVNPHHEARVKESEYQQQKLNKKNYISKVWYELNKDKVIKKTKIDNGSVYSLYVGKYKDFGHLLNLKNKRR